MRLTYTDIKQTHFRNISKAGQYSDTTLLQDFQYSLGQRYQMVFGTIGSYVNQQGYTGTTVATQQYYYYPVGLVNIDAVSITIGNVQYPLTTIYNQQIWNFWNALQIQPTAIPQFIFPRKNDFGIWPIPQAAYTINFYGFTRDRNLLVDDYTTGTVDLTQGSVTVSGTNTVWTSAMVGRWFTVTDTSVPGEGFWYRIKSFVNSTTLALDTDWAASNASTATYRIGESPEIPEEAHSLLSAGTAADYYSGLRNDAPNALRFDNFFWTGSYNNNSRNFGDENIQAGLIGLMNKYEARDRDVIIRRQPPVIPPTYKIWSQTLS